MADDLLTLAQAAKIWGGSAIRLRQLAREGKLPGARLVAVPPFRPVWMVPRAAVTRFRRPLPLGRPRKNGTA